jgi:hypothetical protein
LDCVKQHQLVAEPDQAPLARNRRTPEETKTAAAAETKRGEVDAARESSMEGATPGGREAASGDERIANAAVLCGLRAREGASNPGPFNRTPSPLGEAKNRGHFY